MATSLRADKTSRPFRDRMRMGRWVLVCLLGVCGCSGQGARSSDSADSPWTLVLRDARLLIPGKTEPSGAASLVITGETISGIFYHDDPAHEAFERKLELVDPDRLVDLSGRYIAPGYIDAHVHFLDSASLYTSPDDFDLRSLVSHEDERARIETRLPETLERYLCAGVTTAVGFGGPSWELAVRERLRSESTAARMATTGPFFANFPVGEFTLWTEDDPVLIQLTDAEDASRRAKEIVASGVDLAKIGIAPLPDVPIEGFVPVLEEFVRECHAGGLRVAVHAEQLEVAKLAVQARVDVLAHTVVDKTYDDEFLAQAKDAGVIVTSGLSSFDSYRRVVDNAMTLMDIERRCGDPYAIESWKDIESIPADSLPAIPQAVVWGASMEGRKILKANTRLLIESGIPIAVGTNGGQIGSLHGGSFHRELQFLSEAGMSNAQLLDAATTAGADVLGVGDRGRLEAGMLADLVVLSEDPFTDSSHFGSVEGVVRGGVYITRAKLAVAGR